jgi:hypothetical protein
MISDKTIRGCIEPFYDKPRSGSGKVVPSLRLDFKELRKEDIDISLYVWHVFISASQNLVKRLGRVRVPTSPPLA